MQYGTSVPALKRRAIIECPSGTAASQIHFHDRLGAHELQAGRQMPEDLLNRILWHAMKGSAAPYPAWAITTGAKDWDD